MTDRLPHVFVAAELDPTRCMHPVDGPLPCWLPASDRIHIAAQGACGMVRSDGALCDKPQGHTELCGCPQSCEACKVVDWVRAYLGMLLCPWQVGMLHDVVKHTCDHPRKA
jgi:hypothetical protein